MVGSSELVITETTKLQELYYTTDEGYMDKYMGFSIKCTDEYLKLTQPVKIQRLIDEIDYYEAKLC